MCWVANGINHIKICKVVDTTIHWKLKIPKQNPQSKQKTKQNIGI